MLTTPSPSPRKRYTTANRIRHYKLVLNSGVVIQFESARLDVTYAPNHASIVRIKAAKRRATKGLSLLFARPDQIDAIIEDTRPTK